MAAIDDAFVEGAKHIDDPSNNPEGTSNPQPVETPTEPTVVAPTGPTPEQIASAVAFMDRLKDPEEVQKILLDMAQEIGVEIVPKGKKPEAPAPVTAESAQNTFNKILSKVPDAYQALFQAFAPGIQELIVESQKDVRTRLDQQEQQTTAQLLDSKLVEATNAITKKYPDFNKFDTAMSTLAKEMPWDPDATTLPKYMENLYLLASNGASNSAVVSRVIDKINQNAQSGESTSAVTASGAVREGTKLPSLAEAFAAGIKGQRI